MVGGGWRKVQLLVASLPAGRTLVVAADARLVQLLAAVLALDDDVVDVRVLALPPRRWQEEADGHAEEENVEVERTPNPCHEEPPGIVAT